MRELKFVGVAFLIQHATLSWQQAVSRLPYFKYQNETHSDIHLAVGVLLILIILIICIVKNRQKAADDALEYNVEASQVHGPPTIIATEYHPQIGPTGLITVGGRIVRSPDMKQLNDPSPTFPVPVYYPGESPQNHSAPAMPARFAGHAVTRSGSHDSSVSAQCHVRMGKYLRFCSSAKFRRQPL